MSQEKVCKHKQGSNDQARVCSKQSGHSLTQPKNLAIPSLCRLICFDAKPKKSGIKKKKDKKTPKVAKHHNIYNQRIGKNLANSIVHHPLVSVNMYQAERDSHVADKRAFKKIPFSLRKLKRKAGQILKAHAPE